MKAGAAKIDITPPVGCRLLGSGTASTGVHDPLCARALVVDDGLRSWAIVCLDLMGLDFAFNDRLKAAIIDCAGVDAVVVNCSHTHSAPFTAPWGVESWIECCRDQSEWRDRLAMEIPAVVAEARQGAVEVSLSAGRYPVQVGFNRRMMTEDGIVMVLNEHGQVVPWVDVLVARASDGRCIAMLFSHAAHPVIILGSSTLISADYPGAAVAMLEQELGAEAVPMFAQGCGADINGYPDATGFENSDAAGRKLARAALKAMENAGELRAGEFRMASESMMLPCRELPSPGEMRALLEDAEAKLEVEKQLPGKDTGWRESQVDGLRGLLKSAEAGESVKIRMEMTAIMAGSEWAMLTLSHEPFAEYALWAGDNCPFESMMVLGYTDGCESYVATDEALSLGDRGGYEVQGFPTYGGAAWCYLKRVPLRTGAERQIKAAISGLWGQAPRTQCSTGDHSCARQEADREERLHDSR